MEEHELVLEGKTDNGLNITLRPLSENDWNVLYKWNNNPEILNYSEGDDVNGYDMKTVQRIYRSVSKNAYCFIIEADDKPIGECWLQEMNLERILNEYPDIDSRRIDLMIGEKNYWDRGIGTEVIRLLTEFGFEEEDADLIWGVDIMDYNPRSVRAFQKVGYKVQSRIKTDDSEKGVYKYDLVIYNR